MRKKIQGQTVASEEEENKISTFHHSDADETDGGVGQKTPWS